MRSHACRGPARHLGSGDLARRSFFVSAPTTTVVCSHSLFAGKDAGGQVCKRGAISLNVEAAAAFGCHRPEEPAIDGASEERGIHGNQAATKGCARAVNRGL